MLIRYGQANTIQETELFMDIDQGLEKNKNRNLLLFSRNQVGIR